MTHPDPRAVTVEIRGPVAEVAQVRAWVAGRVMAGGFADVATEDDPGAPGHAVCRMTVIPPQRE